jgi:hypothetical protein
VKEWVKQFRIGTESIEVEPCQADQQEHSLLKKLHWCKKKRYMIEDGKNINISKVWAFKHNGTSQFTIPSWHE